MTELTDELRVGKSGIDPLKHGPEGRRQCFDAMRMAASGYNFDDVLNAAANLVINASRQEQPRRKGARERLERLNENMRHVLMEHYGADGGRKNIFPYNQTIVVPKT